jgi:competence protein ComEA
VRLSSRRSDDADVIRARLRALLADNERTVGWLPSGDPGSGVEGGDPWPARGEPWVDSVATTAPVDPDAVDPDPDPDADDPDTGLPSGVGRHRAPGRVVRWAPGRQGARSLWVAALVAALLVVVWTWLDRPRVEPAPDMPAGSASATPVPSTPPVGEAAETSPTVVVSVVGLVNRPGLVTLPSGSRVAEALEAAGGLLPDADPASVNLAAVLTDGQQIAVGVPGPAVQAAPPGGSAAPVGMVDLNTAGVAELDALPGIGPVLAQRIVDHRDRQGPFRSIDELDDVPGIGPAIAAELADLVTV